MRSLILKAATRLLAGLIIVFSIYLLFRGHNVPGGGFAGGLVAGSAFALMAISEGSFVVRSALRLDPRQICVGGLGIAIASGLVGWSNGSPFLTGLWWAPASGASFSRQFWRDRPCIAQHSLSAPPFYFSPR